MSKNEIVILSEAKDLLTTTTTNLACKKDCHPERREGSAVCRQLQPPVPFRMTNGAEL
jgi:hypothetical protein